MSDSFTIRTATPDDAAAIIDFLKVLADEPENGVTFRSAADVTFTLDEEREIIKGFSDHPASQWLLAFDPQGQLIANSNLHAGRRVFCHTVNMGISVAKDWRNKGVGSAILRQQIAWCADNPHIHRLELEVFADNRRAIHVYEKLGFEHEGVRRAAALKDGRFQDTILMAILFPRPQLEA